MELFLVEEQTGWYYEGDRRVLIGIFSSLEKARAAIDARLNVMFRDGMLYGKSAPTISDTELENQVICLDLKGGDCYYCYIDLLRFELDQTVCSVDFQNGSYKMKDAKQKNNNSRRNGRSCVGTNW